MTCQSCVARVKSELLKMGEVTEAEVQLSAPQATITMQSHIATAKLQSAISKAGPYEITMAGNGMQQHHKDDDKKEGQGWFSTYKPILLIAAFLTGITMLVEMVHAPFDLMRWMHHFMAGFFFSFSFFKLLDLKGFAQNYATYDIIAKKWLGWGYVYPFVELALGVAYLTWWMPAVTNGVSFVVMGINLVGVLQAVLNRKVIRCACLGSVFNLPMSTVTIIEDGLMVAMSAAMLIMIL
jgi:cation transport ATPase